MKVLLVTAKWNSTTTGVDGGSMTALNIIESLHGKATCDILIPEAVGDSIPDGCFNRIHTYSIDNKVNNSEKFNARRLMALEVARRVHRLVKEYDRIIVLHIFNALYFPFYLSPLDFKKIVLFPMFMTPSYVKSYETVPQWYMDQEFKVISSIKRIVTPSEFEARQLVNTYNVGRDTLRVIPRIVSSAFNPRPNRKVSNGRITLTNVSSFRKQKRLNLAINLLKELRTKKIDIRMILVGDIQDENEYSTFIDALAESEMSSQIQHIKHLNHQELNTLYSQADFNISFSACETFGRSIIESLCCGVPNMILDDRGDMQFLIGDGHGALFCTTVEEMSTKLSELITDETTYRQLTTEARKYGRKFQCNKLNYILANSIIEEIK